MKIGITYILLFFFAELFASCTKSVGCTAQRDFNGEYQVTVQKSESSYSGSALLSKNDTSYTDVMTVSCNTCPYELLLSDHGLFSKDPLKVKTYEIIDNDHSCNTHAKSGENDPIYMDITPESFIVAYDFRSKPYYESFKITGNRIK